MITNKAKINVGRLTYKTDASGKEYAVVPVVMMKEFVLNNSHGRTFYPAKELAKFPRSWNLKPVLIDHPKQSGASGTDPEVLKSQGIGFIQNTRWDNGRLKAEVWIDQHRANILDPRIMKAMAQKIVMNVSTGHYSDLDKSTGTYNNMPYEQTAFNIVPDHLAILPDSIGALSVDNGAGLLRNKAEGDEQAQGESDAPAIEEPLENEDNTMAEANSQEVAEVQPLKLNSVEDIVANCEGQLKEYVKEAFDLLENSLKEQVKLIVENSDGAYTEDDFIGQTPKDIRKTAKMVQGLIDKLNSAAPVANEESAEVEAEVPAQKLVSNYQGQQPVAEAPVENEGEKEDLSQYAPKSWF